MLELIDFQIERVPISVDREDEMTKSMMLCVAAVVGLQASSALAGSNPALTKQPPPDFRVARTTPAVGTPPIRALPQARQVNQPTGKIPNLMPWAQPVDYPQASGIRDCSPSKPKC